MKLEKALARIEDSMTRDGSAGGTDALGTGVKKRGNGQGRGGGVRRHRGGRSRQARRQRSSASPSAAAMGFAAPRAVSAAVDFTGPRATAAAAEASAAATEAATSATAAAAATIRTPWRVGTIACLFPLRPARTFLCRMSSDTSRVANHMPPSTIHCPAG